MKHDPPQLRQMRPTARLVFYAMRELGASCRVKDLAGEVGVGRSAIYRALDALHAAGLISRRRWRQKCSDRDTQPLNGRLAGR